MLKDVITLDGRLVPVVQGFSLFPDFRISESAKADREVGFWASADKYSTEKQTGAVIPVRIQAVYCSAETPDFAALVKLLVSYSQITGSFYVSLDGAIDILSPAGRPLDHSEKGYWFRRFEPFNLIDLLEKTARQLIEENLAEIAERIFNVQTSPVVFYNA